MTPRNLVNISANIYLYDVCLKIIFLNIVKPCNWKSFEVPARIMQIQISFIFGHCTFQNTCDGVTAAKSVILFDNFEYLVLLLVSFVAKFCVQNL